MRRISAHLGVLAVLLASSSARADGAADAALAEKLFKEGRRLMLAGDYAAGCPKLAESERLDPGAGTLLNLGECYEKAGKAASAWATYREAEPMARRLGQKERAEHAAQRAAAIEPTLAYVVLKVASQPSGVSVTVDGSPIAEPAWSTPLPVDPGTHTISATGAKRKAWSKSVSVDRSARVDVPVPVLEKAPEPVGPVGGDPGATRSTGSTQRTLGWVGVGLGGAAIITGGVFGFIAKGKNDDAHADGHCTDVDCDARGQQLTSQAKDAALLSTIFFAAGGALAATGVVLVVTAPGGQKVAISPVGIGGTW